MSLFDTTLPGQRVSSRIGDAYEVTKKPRDLDVASLDAIPFANMDSIPQGGAYHPEYTMKSPTQIKSGTYFERGDVLVAKITPSFENGKQALVTDLPTPFGYATTEVIPLQPRADGHDPRLLFFFLLHPDVRHRVAECMEGATGRHRVPVDVLLDVQYPDLTLQEQTAAADILETTQQMIAVENGAIETATALKTATMESLLSRGLRGEQQKETEIGPIPDSWSLVRLVDVRESIQYGTSTRCTYDKSIHPVLRIPNIDPQRIDSYDLKYCTLSDDEAARYRLALGDLVFVRTNGVMDRLGSCAVYSGEPPGALFASYLIRVRLQRDLVNPYFVSSFLSSQAGVSSIASRATTASDGKFNLNTAAIESLPIPVPPTLSEQNEIVLVLHAIDRKIDLHRRKREVALQLFNALLHKLIVGESPVFRPGDLVSRGLRQVLDGEGRLEDEPVHSIAYAQRGRP